MRFRGLLVCIAALAIGATTASAAPARTRAQFAAAIATIKPGMRAADVRAKLGAPDDVKTERDPGGIRAARTAEVWRYGTHGHLTFGTLGTVHVEADGTVQYVFGGRGTPPRGFAEADLERLLELVDAVPSYDAPLDPLALIRAVDALQPLGKERALAVLDEYLRVSSPFDDGGREGVFLVLRALFDVPAAGMPAMMVGAAPHPTDPKALPRFPLAIVDDVPLKLVTGYMLAGKAEDPEMDVAAFRKVGTLRGKPLAPSGLALDAIDKYVAVGGPLAHAMPVDDDLRVSIYDQALRFAAPIYRAPDATFDAAFPYGVDFAARWTARRVEVAKLRAIWNPTTMQLTRADGSTLAPTTRPRYQRVWWDLALASTTQARVTFERATDATVAVELRLDLKAGAKLAADSILIVDPTTGATLGTLHYDAITAPANSTTGTVTSQRIQLAHGHSIRVELVSGARGPTLAP